MKHVFTVITTSWLRYSTKLEGMLLSVVAQSVMLLRDWFSSGHNTDFEAMHLLVIYSVRSVRQQKTRRYLPWFHCNDYPTYVHTALGILLTWHSRFGSMEQKTLDILEGIFIRKASWLCNLVREINFKILMSYYLLWRSCYCNCSLISAFEAIANAFFTLIWQKTQFLFLLQGGQMRCSSSFSSLKSWASWMVCQGLYGTWLW